MKSNDSEAKFTRDVLFAAKAGHWQTAHFRPARTADGGWRTAVSGDGKGFPDLILLRGPEKIAAELKMPGNKPSPDQEAWLAAFRAAGFEVYVWYPSDWSFIKERLGRE